MTSHHNDRPVITVDSAATAAYLIEKAQDRLFLFPENFTTSVAPDGKATIYVTIHSPEEAGRAKGYILALSETHYSPKVKKLLEDFCDGANAVPESAVGAIFKVLLQHLVDRAREILKS